MELETVLYIVSEMASEACLCTTVQCVLLEPVLQRILMHFFMAEVVHVLIMARGLKGVTKTSTQ